MSAQCLTDIGHHVDTAYARIAAIRQRRQVVASRATWRWMLLHPPQPTADHFQGGFGLPRMVEEFRQMHTREHIVASPHSYGAGG